LLLWAPDDGGALGHQRAITPGPNPVDPRLGVFGLTMCPPEMSLTQARGMTGTSSTVNTAR
jgi:hypothetical protein